MARFIDELKRTHGCGALRAADVGREVVLFGWVAHRRDFGGCVFIDLRDRDGLTQIVFDLAKEVVAERRLPQLLAREEPYSTEEGRLAAHRLAETVRREWVIGVRGTVAHRGAENVNPRLATGEVEVRVVEAVVFNRAETPPFSVEDEIKTDEEIRLAHRYLDLRRGPLQRALRARHELTRATRAYLAEEGCLELETPFLVKYTPGGARNFLVPARLAPGKFYALAESPQLFKQLFMVAGFDRYYQVVKCFRDEALRVDRQPEFTQIDIELSFASQDDVFSLVEGLMARVFCDVLGIDLLALYPGGRFPRMAYAESMARFGNDKPDLRFGLEHVDLTSLVVEHEGGGVPLFRDLVARRAGAAERGEGGREIVKALVLPREAGLSRPETEELERGLREIKGFQGLLRAKVAEDGSYTQSPISKHITPELRHAVQVALGARAGDVICFQVGREGVVHTALAKLRLDVARRMKLIPSHGHGGAWRFLWVTNPPLFERDEETGRWVAAHHAFTRPLDEHLPRLEFDPESVLCHRYDLVLNGFELGGGSIRLHDPDVQARVFRALGISDEEARDKFGFLLEALRSGAPPHGGIALGMDRLAMLLTGSASLRDVIPFPKTSGGLDLLTGAPGPVDAGQLRELHVRTLAPRPDAAEGGAPVEPVG